MWAMSKSNLVITATPRRHARARFEARFRPPSHASRYEQQQDAQQAEHEGGAEEVGHPEDAHLGDRHFENAEYHAARGKLREIDGEAQDVVLQPRPGPRD